MIIVGWFFLTILCIWCVLAQSRRLFGNFLCVLFIAIVVTSLDTELDEKGHELANGAARRVTKFESLLHFIGEQQNFLGEKTK